MPDSSTILLVDDEDLFRSSVSARTRRIPRAAAKDGEEALERFSSEPIDLVVLDLMLPKLDGSRSASGSARRAPFRSSCSPPGTTSSTRCSDWNLGADDYITKPFSIRESRSRVRALLRRVPPAQQDRRDGEVIEAEGLLVDPARRTVEAVVATDLRRVRAPAHARVESAVSSAAGSCSRPWGDSAYREPRTIDVHVRHLREKLEQDASDPEFILTVRGAGYRFRDT